MGEAVNLKRKQAKRAVERIACGMLYDISGVG